MQKAFTFARGARQLVVHEALDTMSSFFASYFSSFTPITNMGASAEKATAERMQHMPLSLEDRISEVRGRASSSGPQHPTPRWLSPQ